MPSIKDPTGILSGCGPLILICLMSGKKDGPPTGSAAREYRIQQEQQRIEADRAKAVQASLEHIEAQQRATR
jgi:hypothetical protein